MIKKISLLLLVTSSLVGCASKPMKYTYYQLPPSTPSATLKSAMTVPKAGDGMQTATLFARECGGAAQGALFINKDNESTPNGPIQIEAGRPLVIAHNEFGPTFGMIGSRGDYCQAIITVTLEPGKAYTLVAGPGYKEGPIPIFTGNSTCRVAIRDDATGQFIRSPDRVCPQKEEAPKSTWEKYKFMFE